MNGIDIRGVVLKCLEGMGCKSVDVNNTDTMNDLNLDSLDCFELVMALEDKFNIEIPDEEFKNKSYEINFGDVIKYLEKRSKE